LGNWDEVSSSGYALVLNAGRPAFLWSEQGTVKSVALDNPLEGHHWYTLRVEVDTAAGQIHLNQAPLSNIMNRYTDQALPLESDDKVVDATPAVSAPEVPFRIGAGARRDGERWLAANGFNGKIGDVSIQRRTPTRTETIADWHFGRSRRDDGLLLWDVIDESPNQLHGTCHNAPTRAVAGHSFTGLVDDFRLVPDEYDAIHFHDDAP
jgi:N,N-dimethylformamidase